MYFFKSVLDESEVELQDGQLAVRNITGRPFRVGTPGQLVRPNGVAIVDAKDPVVQHNLQLKRIAVVNEQKSSPAPKKARKKKSDLPVEAEQPEVTEQQAAVEETKVDEVAAETPAVEAAPVEAVEAPAEIVADAEQPELAPNVDESSL